MSVPWMPRQRRSKPYCSTRCSAITQVRVSVVTTEKPVATKDAAWNAASAMPITGPRASSRAACRPGSPKQAIT